MGAYILEQESEGTRLEKQNARNIYSVAEELKELEFDTFNTVLDAGCGTGAITRYILEKHNVKKITAIDFSEERLKQNEEFSRKVKNSTELEFLKKDLTSDLGLAHKYDLILSRFVLHHLSNPYKVVENLAQNLEANGELAIIDSDGIFFNMYSDDEWLQQKLETVRKELKVDMFVARKLKSFFFKANLKNVESRIITMHFTGDDLAFERQQYVERFPAVEGVIASILGAKDCQKFFERYLDALEKPGAELFYTKFICRGKK